MKRLLLILLFAGFMFGCSDRSHETGRPNILFIMSDDHTGQAWGIYGGILQDYVHTPNIQRLAKEGCVLDNCLVSNSICTPSRAAILTGQYSHINGVTTLGGDLLPEQNHISKVLGKSGYQTAIIGKWHLHKEPDGFDYYCVLPGQGRYFDPVMKTKDNWEDHQKGGKVYTGFSTDVIADMTIDWIEKRDDSRPFIAFCHFKATHEPWRYPDRLADLYQDQEIPVPESFYDRGAETTGRSFVGQSVDNLTKRFLYASEFPDKRVDYLNYSDLPFSVDGLDPDEARYKTYQKWVKDFMRCGAAIDENIGKLLKYLDKTGLDKNTVVIYTADQGYFMGEHGWFDKRLIYEESIHMPFVIRYPEEIPAGTRNSDIIENVDFSALFADFAGVEYPSDMQGRSFRENLKGKTHADWREYGYYRYWQDQDDRPAHFGIRGKRYKLAFFYGKELQHNKLTIPGQTGGYWDFFDLKKDPDELHNAYYDMEYQEIIKDMKKELIHQRELLGDTDEDHPEVLAIIERHWDE